MSTLPPDRQPDPADADPDESPVTAAQHAAIGDELLRIMTEADLSADAGAAARVLMLLPLAGPAEAIAFLRTVPTGSGWAGMRAGAERLARERGFQQDPGAPDDATA